MKLALGLPLQDSCTTVDFQERKVSMVQIVSEPVLVAIPTTGNLTDHVEENADLFPHHASFVREIDHEWQPVTATEFRDTVRAVAKGLIADGIQAGDRVAIYSRTRYEWTVADYAIWYAGAITVPIYETSSPEQVAWIMSDAAVVATFFESPHVLATFDEVASTLPNMTSRYVFTEDTLNALAIRGSEISDEALDTRRSLANPEDTATLIYTSGTTGNPKGCILSHRNFMTECDNLVASLPEIFNTTGASTLLFLPLAHVFGRAIQLAMFRGRVTIGHCPNPSALLKQLQSMQPTFLLAVPRVFEKVFNGASAKAHEESPIKGKIFDWAASISIKFSEAIDQGRIPVLLSIQHKLCDRLVYSKLRAAMGGRVTHAISGGASLGARLGHFYRGLGLIVLEGYGLTETSAGAVLNRPSGLKIGSVGRPVPGVSVAIADDGEILLQGPNIFEGYWQNIHATLEVFSSDGWFHTGDIGSFDQDGFLTITGRKKEILVTAGGKNVAPAVLEDRLRANPIISQCVVVGDGKPFIGALVTLDQEALPGILSAHHIASAPIDQLTDDSEVRALVQEAINDANKAVSNAEAIKKFVILPTDLTIDNGYLTPKLSIKRHLVTLDFAKEIESLYQ